MRSCIVFIMLFIFSCKTDESNSVFIDADVEISVINDLGEDLLNPQNANALDVSNIKVYYLDGKGNKKLQSQSNSFYIIEPKGHIVDRYLIRLFLNMPSFQKSNPAYTYIDFGDGIQYELKAHFIKLESATYYNQLWLNGEPVIFEDLYPTTGLRIIEFKK